MYSKVLNLLSILKSLNLNTIKKISWPNAFFVFYFVFHGLMPFLFFIFVLIEILLAHPLHIFL